jgi:hypothetical protein
MKKVYLSIIGLTLVGSVMAQKNYPTESSVSKISPASEETTKTVATGFNMKAQGVELWANEFADGSEWDASVPNIQGEWEILSTTPAQMVQYMGAMNSTSKANGFGVFNGIQYLLAPPVDAQDALLTYNGTLPDLTNFPAVTVSFEQRYKAFNTDETWIEFSTNGGADWTGMEINKPLAFGVTVQNVISVNVSSIIGNQANVMMRFRWISASGDDQFGSGYGWMVDDVKISSAADNDLSLLTSSAVSGPQAIEYHQIPLTQLSPITFTGSILNVGAASQTNTILTATVGAVDFTSTPITLPILDTAFAETNTFTPAGLGAYAITYVASADEVEDVPANNTAMNTITVTNAVYAVDNGIAIGAIANLSSEPEGALKVGNVMDIINDDRIDSMYITMTTTATNVGQEIYGEIWKYNAVSEEYGYIGSTGTVVITAGNNGKSIALPMAELLDVFAGDDLLVMAGHFGGKDSPRFATAQKVPFGIVQGVRAGGTVADMFSLTDASAVMVRLHMNKSAKVAVNEASNLNFGKMFPNPTNGSTSINFELKNTSNVAMQVVDVTGKVMFSSNEGVKTAGAHTISLNAAAFANGMYYVTISTDEAQVTQKLIKK